MRASVAPLRNAPRRGRDFAFGAGLCGALGLVGCAAELRDVDPIARELTAMSRGLTTAHAETFRDILATSLASDAYVCTPSAQEVFFGPVPEGARTIVGTMPHYGLYHGPMRYHVRRERERWVVSLRLGVRAPARDAVLELPDCALRDELDGPIVCEGTPYAQAEGLDACPKSGTFRAPATPHNVAALLDRWSREAEQTYNRDADYFGIPVRYDFDVVEAVGEHPAGVDDTLPLSPTCGRTPYFSALRSGWSLPIVAHELGHFLGLLDEYEMFSGLVWFYPKTPFAGAEVSRMGLSMREHTRILPLHHYLVLRRYFCPEPESRDPYENAPR